MKSKRSLRFFSKTMTAVGLTLAVSACATVYDDEWDQTTNVPDLNQPTQRSDALLDYCKSLHSRGDLNLAAGICNRAHEIDPTDPAPLVELARVLESLERTAAAEEAYRAALLLDPQQTDALYGLGKIYIDQQRYDLAMGPLEAAAASDSDDPRFYNALGVIMDQQGQHQEAQVYYQQGLAHSPRNVSLRNNLGLSMVLAGEPEAGLAMLRDVAAEPESGATAGHNLEMASQIAAQSILDNSDNSALTPESQDSPPQTGALQQQPQDGTDGAGGEDWPSQDLSTLTPSSSVDEAVTPASDPMPLLQPHTQPHGESIPASPPAVPTQNMQKNTQSLDHDLADAMVQEPVDEAQVADMSGEMADERPFEPATPEQVNSEQVEPEQVAALPEAEPVAAPATEFAGDLEADLAAISAPNSAADHTGDPSSYEGSGIPRDWSLAAQAVFAKSGVAVPEPSQITPQERTAANDAFHATPAPEASTQTAAAEPTMTVKATPHGDLTLALASTPETDADSSPIADGYPIDEDTFYTAQLASFLTAERARSGWQILQASAGEILGQSDGFIVRADLGPEVGTFYRVRTGMMEDRAAATQFCLDLKAAGVDCMPVEASIQETSETLVDKVCQSDSPAVLCGTAQRSELAPKGAPHGRG
jgi:Flp pilus assembly protein TadD